MISITDAMKCYSWSATNDSMHPKQAIHILVAASISAIFARLKPCIWTDVVLCYQHVMFFKISSSSHIKKPAWATLLGLDRFKAFNSGRRLRSSVRDAIKCINDCLHVLIPLQVAVHQYDCATISTVALYTWFLRSPQYAWKAMHKSRTTVSSGILVC